MECHLDIGDGNGLSQTSSYGTPRPDEFSPQSKDHPQRNGRTQKASPAENRL